MVPFGNSEFESKLESILLQNTDNFSFDNHTHLYSLLPKLFTNSEFLSPFLGLFPSYNLPLNRLLHSFLSHPAHSKCCCHNHFPRLTILNLSPPPIISAVALFFFLMYKLKHLFFFQVLCNLFWPTVPSVLSSTSYLLQNSMDAQTAIWIIQYALKMNYNNSTQIPTA